MSATVDTEQASVPQVGRRAESPRAGESPGRVTPSPGLPSAELWLRRIAVLLVGLAAYVLWPMATVLVISGFIVLVCDGAFRWLVRRLGGRRRLAAVLATGFLALVFFVPVVAAAYAGIRQAGGVLRALSDEVQSHGDLDSVLDGLPPGVRWLAANAASSVEGGLRTVDRALLSAAPKLLPSFGWAVAQLFLSIVTVFYLFNEGPSVVALVRRLLPLEAPTTDALFAEFREVAQGLFGGGVLTFLFHGFAASFGYLIFGIPHVAFLGLLSALASFIPWFGAGLVWVPLALQQALTGHVLRGVGLAVWGLVVVGAGEYALRPWLSKGRMALPRMLLFLMFFGGLELWGAKGLLLGPLIGSLAVTAVRLVIRSQEARRAPMNRAPAG